MCKASYTYGTLYCTPFRYSYGCFGFRFDFLHCYTQRKQPQLSTSKGPRQSHIDRPHFSGACCAVLRYRQTRAVMVKKRPWLLIKKKSLFPPQITLLWENYTGKTPLPHLQRKDAVLHDWKCQIKHTVGGVSKQVFAEK